MANIMLGFPNRAGADSADYSGGDWVEAFPLDNLKDRAFSRVARSTDADVTSTTFTIDFGRTWGIRIFAVLAHNFSFSARIQVEASNNADMSDLISDITFDAYGSFVGSDWDINQLEWENDNYWLGSYTSEDTEGQTAISTYIYPVNVVARFWRVTIYDQANDDGFVQLGRLFMGDAYMQPTYNYNQGGSLGYEDSTGIETTLSGAEYYDPREPVRVMRIQLTYMTDAEGFDQALELTRRAGVWREVFIVADPDDVLRATQRNFMARPRQLNPLEQMMLGYNSMSFEFKEIR